MCIQTGARNNCVLISHDVNSVSNLFAIKTFYIEKKNEIISLVGEVGNHKYKLTKDDYGIRVPANNSKQKVYQYVGMKNSNMSSSTWIMNHDMTLNLGYHADLFIEDMIFVIDKFKPIPTNYKMITIPIMFKKSDVQFIGDTEIVVKTFVIPKPNIVFEIFKAKAKKRKYYDKSFEESYVEVYDMLEKIIKQGE